MPLWKRLRKLSEGSQSRSPKKVRPRDRPQTARRKGLESEFSSVTLEARSEASKASTGRSSAGYRGHEFRKNIARDNARAHFGDVYNIHPPAATKSRDDDHEDNDDDANDVYLNAMKALAFQSMSSRLASVSPAYAETCKWMLDCPEYLDWRNAKLRHLHHGVLWIKGNAGTGKSTLMRCIHDHALRQHADETVVSFFFNARSPDLLVKSTEGMYRCLLHQIFSNLTGLKSSMPQEYMHMREQQSWTIELLEEGLRNAVLALETGKSITIYIDALDECKIDDVRRAIEFFEDIMELATKKKLALLVCVSSRYYPQITMKHHKELRLEREAEHMQDISHYIKSKLIVPEALRIELSSEILRRSAGVFLWVVLVVKQLRESYDAGSTRSKLRATLDAVPQELHALFAAILKGAGSALVLVVQFVLFSPQEVSPEELYFAVQTCTRQLTTGSWESGEIDVRGMERRITHLARGLVEFDTVRHAKTTFKPSRTALFIHESVREHFLSHALPKLDRRLQQRVDAGSHASISHTCLQYINTICTQSRLFDLHDRANTGLDPDKYPLARYSVFNMLHHLEIAFLGGAVGLAALEMVPLQNMILLEQELAKPDGLSRCDVRDLQPEHPSTLLYLLLRHGCEALPTALLRSKFPNARPEDQVHEIELNDALATPDLRSMCGGAEGSALHIAIRKDLKDIVELMLCCDSDVNLKERWYDTPIGVAVRYSTLEMVKLLYEHGAQIRPSNPFRSLLHLAVLSRQQPLVQFLVNKGIDVNAQDFEGYTAIHFAYNERNGDTVSNRLGDFDVAMARILLNAGANLDAPNRYGESVLMRAASRRDVEYARFLLKNGANVHARDNSGQTAIHMVESRTGLPLKSARALQGISTLEALLDAGGDIDAEGGDYGTVLIAASVRGNYRLVEFLVERGAALEYRSAEFGTAIEAAQAGGHYYIADILSTAAEDDARIQAEDENED